MRVLSVIFAPLLFLLRICVQTVFLAIGQVWANKVRGMLTALGIIIGVWAVISVISGLGGMKGYVLSEFEKFGARKMWVWGEVPEAKRTTMNWSDVKMSLYEAKLILSRSPSIEMLTPLTRNNWDVSYGKTVNRGVRVTGIWPEWHEIEDRQVIYGRPFSRIDDEERRQVCLINEEAISELKLNIDPVGDYLQLHGRRFLIIGVVETKQMGAMFGGGEAQTELYIPFNTLKMMNPYTGTWFMIQTIDPDAAEDAKAEVRFILRKHRNLEPEDEDTFGMFIMQGEIEQFNAMSGVITMVAGLIVSISLLVGGIGIMNIMLVSVSERTREIGLRKAVGARPPIVLLQFLIEAVMLCLVGGMVGLGLAFATVEGLKHMPKMPMEHASVSTGSIFLAVGFSAGVGVIFGMFPAIKAAMLNPIDALRHE